MNDADLLKLVVAQGSCSSSDEILRTMIMYDEALSKYSNYKATSLVKSQPVEVQSNLPISEDKPKKKKPPLYPVDASTPFEIPFTNFSELIYEDKIECPYCPRGEANSNRVLNKKHFENVHGISKEQFYEYAKITVDYPLYCYETARSRLTPEMQQKWDIPIKSDKNDVVIRRANKN